MTLDLTVSETRAREAVLRAAEGWGAEVEQGAEGWTLHLPVVAGLRRGFVSGHLEILSVGDCSRLRFLLAETHFSLHLSSVVVLLISAAGGVLSMLWPFRPSLLPVAPFGVVLALGGWFLVLNRLRNAGPEEFFKAVEIEAGAAGASGEVHGEP